jgi:hypothetical protein
MRILSIAKKYNQRPSEIMDITDSYVAFCFDEACEYIIECLREELTPTWLEDEEHQKTTESKSNNNAQVIEILLKS